MRLEVQNTSFINCMQLQGFIIDFCELLIGIFPLGFEGVGNCLYCKQCVYSAAFQFPLRKFKHAVTDFCILPYQYHFPITQLAINASFCLHIQFLVVAAWIIHWVAKWSFRPASELDQQLTTPVIRAIFSAMEIALALVNLMESGLEVHHPVNVSKLVTLKKKKSSRVKHITDSRNRTSILFGPVLIERWLPAFFLGQY